MTKNPKYSFYCGTSNIMLPVPNKSHFPTQYQNKSRLSYYASLLNSLEVNSTFYKLPLPRTVARWATEVPDGFRFTFKLWREVTHAKDLAYHNDDIDRFLTAIHPALGKAGCLLIQFSQSIEFSEFRRVEEMVKYIIGHSLFTGWRLALEFRDKSWYNNRVREMLDAHHAALVQHDMPRSATPRFDVEASFAYYRFHGQAGDYRGSYPDDLLADYALDIEHQLSTGKDVYVYFNNTIGDAIHNALDLQKLVTTR